MMASCHPSKQYQKLSNTQSSYCVFLLLQCTVRQYATIILLFRVSFSICKKYWKPWSCRCLPYGFRFVHNFYFMICQQFLRKLFFYFCQKKKYLFYVAFASDIIVVVIKYILIVFRGPFKSSVCVLASEQQDPFFLLALDGVD